MTKAPPKKTLPRPHKRPSQDRARFTVQAIYDAFVRIWRRDGPQATTTRAIAHEAGYAVGTLYEYFPNREAVLSGYFRHCLEHLLARMRAADDDASLAWQARLRRLVAVSLDEAGEAPYFDAEMLLAEAAIAGLAEHRKAFARLCDTWQSLLDGWPDLKRLERHALEDLVTHLWGARRYAILLGRGRVRARDVDRATAMLIAMLH